jgi:hypothetical protein
MNAASAITTPGPPMSSRLYSSAGWLSMRPNATLANGVNQTFTFTTMNNPNYIPTTPITDWCVKGFSTNMYYKK